MKIESWKRALLAAALIAAIGGCEKDDNDDITGPVVTPGNTIESVVSGRTEIMAGDSTSVTAFVVDTDGEPLEGAKVGFTTTWGAIASTEVMSGAGGRATNVLLTPISNLDVVAEVRASTSGRVKFTSVEVMRFVDTSDTASVAEITLEVAPGEMLADGVSESEIEVTARDGEGAAAAGVLVRLVAGERFQDVNGDGTFTAGSDVLLDDVNGNTAWDAAGVLAGWVTTDAGGHAAATFRAGVLSGAFAVRASAGNMSVEMPLTLDPLPEIAYIELDAARAEIQVDGTGGVESTDILATGLDADGNPVPAGLPVTFEIVEGPNGGEEIEDQGYGPVTVVTGENGVARARLRSGTISGTVVLRASTPDVVSAATRIAIAAGPPHYIDAGANPVNIRAWDLIGVPSTITAIVSDVYENPVRDGTVVYFTTEEGTVTPSSPTDGGFAEATFYSGVPRNDGIVHITSSTAGGALETEASLITSGPPTSVTILSAPTELNADGRARGRIVVRVLDVNDNYVVAGTIVQFEATLGTVDASAATGDGWYDSIAESRLTSAVLEMDSTVRTPDDGVGGTSVVSARAGLGGGANASTTVDFLTTSASAAKSSSTLPTSADMGESIPFDLTVKDYWGNPLGGHVWQFTVVGGGQVTASGSSNRFGVVSGLTFVAPATPTKVTVQAVDIDPLYGDGIVLSKTIDIQ